MPQPDPTSQPTLPTAEATTQRQPNLAILLIVMMVAVVLLFAFLLSKRGAIESDNVEHLTELKLKITSLESEARRRGIPLPEQQDSIDALAKRISKDSLALTTAAAGFQEALSSKEATLNSVQRDLDAAITTNERLAAESTKLRQQLLQLQSSQTDAPLLQQHLDKLKLQLAEKEASLLELGNRPAPALVSKLREQLNAETLRNTQLLEKINKLEAGRDKSDIPKELQLLEEQVTTLIKENQELKDQLQKNRAADDSNVLFINSPDQLAPAPGKLVTELTKLEGAQSDQLAAAYTRIAETHKASIVANVHFKPSAADLSFTDLARIKDRIQDVQPSSHLLVIAYSSKNGDTQTNKTLSSARATAVASTVNQLKKSDQPVQAVFLGQTDRFSDPSDSEADEMNNQVCEIWEIKAK